jgi:hypothetical protein
VKQKTVAAEEELVSKPSPMGSMNSLRVSSDKVEEKLEEKIVTDVGSTTIMAEGSRSDELRNQWMHKVFFGLFGLFWLLFRNGVHANQRLNSCRPSLRMLTGAQVYV